MHSVQREDGTETITIYGLGELRVAHSDHPNFAAIKAAATATNPDELALEGLFNVAQAITDRFERLTDRISVRGGQIYLDLEPVHSVLADAIIACMQADEDFTPLVNFMTKLEANPNPRSREALFTWLDNRNFTITPDGDIVGYKGVSFDIRYKSLGIHRKHESAGVSTSSGHAFVDGLEYGATDATGRVIKAAYIPYPIGSVVEMPRSEVINDNGVECSQGLHVGTFQFAKGYAESGQMLEVHINPRDVVSVPTRSNSQKIRVCRLKVVGELEAQYTQPIVHHADTYYDDYDVAAEPLHVADAEDLFDDEDHEKEYGRDFYSFPEPEEFIVMLQRARRRKQSVVPYIENMTAREGTPWKYAGEGDPTYRTNWSKIAS